MEDNNHTDNDNSSPLQEGAQPGEQPHSQGQAPFEERDFHEGQSAYQEQPSFEEQPLQFDSQPQQYVNQPHPSAPVMNNPGGNVHGGHHENHPPIHQEPQLQPNELQPKQPEPIPPEPIQPRAATAGFCGKIPAHGDFVSRNLPDEFLIPWNQWTQTVIGASQEQLENLWLETYLTSPIWRFAVSPGACCANGFCGIMIPSVDKVGRYFPFTMIEFIDDEPLNVMRNGSEWFTAAQNVMLRGLEEDINIEDLLARAANLPILANIAQEKSTQSTTNYSIETPHHSRQTLTLPLESIENTNPFMPGITQILIRRLFPQHTIWWTEGSDRIQPTMLICEGMPPISGFSAMLDGDWDRWGWPKEQVAKI